MKVIVEIPDNEATFGMKVLKSLAFIKKAKPMSVVTPSFGMNSKKSPNKYAYISRENLN
ncbi:hypothetical protein [Flavobacterium sp. CS20]|uniref:hypothetical protein n=1 Tax=Flavobacterium sp. CS20 TaxID=2775246 RepID=UPI001B3A1268|nr:hypothetical protein [Flavobacterium sp. CS20]QTY27582.1 hypothetical protein IGB25_03270 [Flavobacterium sp. CS20]